MGPQDSGTSDAPAGAKNAAIRENGASEWRIASFMDLFVARFKRNSGKGE
jgi:hypothetical protein